MKAAANEQNYQLIQKGSIAVVRADALERKYVKSLIENIITFHKNYRIAVGENNIEEIKLNKLLVQERAVHLYKLLQPSIK